MTATQDQKTGARFNWYSITAAGAVIFPALASAISTGGVFTWVNFLYIALGAIVGTGPALAAKKISEQKHDGLFDLQPELAAINGLDAVKTKYEDLIGSVTTGLDQVVSTANSVLPGILGGITKPFPEVESLIRSQAGGDR